MSTYNHACAGCWGSGITMDGRLCTCRNHMYGPLTHPTPLNNNKTETFNIQKEIQDLKDRIKILEDKK